MGTNVLTSRVDGNKIPASDHNELVQAFLIDIVPRNNSRVPQDIIGQLGNSALRWLRAYVKEYFIGDAANNLKIHEGAPNEIWIENGANDLIKITDGTVALLTNNVTRFRITDAGIDWGVVTNFSIPSDRVANRYLQISPEVTQINTGTGFVNFGAPYDVTLVSGRRYIIQVQDYDTLQFTATPDNAIFLDLGATRVINWGDSAGGEGLKPWKEYYFTSITTGVHTFQWSGRRCEFVNVAFSIKEF